MKKIIIVLVLAGIATTVYANCTTDFSCYNNCLLQGPYYPSKQMECRNICTYCN